jgi:hypothetical protein
VIKALECGQERLWDSLLENMLLVVDRILRKKLKVNGQVDKYKASLVAKVYSQVLDIIILKLFH